MKAKFFGSLSSVNDSGHFFGQSLAKFKKVTPSAIYSEKNIWTGQKLNQLTLNFRGLGVAQS
jgi:hypothetical protein